MKTYAEVEAIIKLFCDTTDTKFPEGKEDRTDFWGRMKGVGFITEEQIAIYENGPETEDYQKITFRRDDA